MQHNKFRNYNTLTLILGSNLNNKIQNIEVALRQLYLFFGKPIILSSYYETAAWGKTNQPSFINIIAQYNTNTTAFNALEIILNIEKEMGRLRLEKMGPRNIDIDILFFGNQIINSSNLTLPHPHIAQRKFVLKPLAEVDAFHIHPTFNKSIEEMLQNCTDDLDVKKFITP